MMHQAPLFAVIFFLVLAAVAYWRWVLMIGVTVFLSTIVLGVIEIATWLEHLP